MQPPEPSGPLERPTTAFVDFLTRLGLWPADEPRSGSAAACGSIIRLPGGANNAVYRVDVPAGSFLLKQYFTHPDDNRDRLGAEVAFCRFAWRHGIQVPPRFVAESRDQHLALFEFLAGRPVTGAEVDAALVGQAIRFCQRLHEAQTEADANDLPFAAESCFSIQQHLACVNRRLDRLSTIDPTTRLEEDVLQFVRLELGCRWNGVREWVLDRCKVHGISPEEELSPADRVVSPSDFGFHNALVDGAGTVRFFDFEYAGWDDPAKLACDFFCQVAVPVPRGLFPAFCASIVSRLREPERVRQRMDVLLSVYQLKWCCIVLNEFLPVGRARRQFSGACLRSARQPETQFEKARRLLAELEDLR